MQYYSKILRGGWRYYHTEEKSCSTKSFIESVTTNVNPCASKQVLQKKICIDADFMLDGAKAKETFSAANKSKLMKQMDDVQQHLPAIRKYFLQYYLKFSPYILSRFPKIWRRLLGSALKTYSFVDKELEVLLLRHYLILSIYFLLLELEVAMKPPSV